ncbi:MAG: hypothetical protein AAF208_05735 [Cyanobacteria bacterium P01_A01_bin.45]
MPTCCCYRSFDGEDSGCTTVAGNSCPEISGYELINQSPGPCDETISAKVADFLEKKTGKLTLSNGNLGINIFVGDLSDETIQDIKQKLVSFINSSEFDQSVMELDNATKADPSIPALGGGSATASCTASNDGNVTCTASVTYTF